MSPTYVPLSMAGPPRAYAGKRDGRWGWTLVHESAIKMILSAPDLALQAGSRSEERSHHEAREEHEERKAF